MTERKKGYVRAHERAVKAFAAQQGVKKGSAAIVLDKLLARRNYKTLTAFRSRNDLVEDTGYCDKTIKKAMATLRRHGIIEPIAYEHGGRGMSTVYKFRQNSQNGGTNLTPYEEPDAGNENGGTFLPKQGNKSSETGEQNHPPTIRQKNIKEDKEPPSRRQEATLGPTTEVEQALFSQWLREGTYGEAVQKLKRYREQQPLAAE